MGKWEEIHRRHIKTGMGMRLVDAACRPTYEMMLITRCKPGSGWLWRGCRGTAERGRAERSGVERDKGSGAQYMAYQAGFGGETLAFYRGGFCG
jgi:hypothetical protein